MDKLRDGVKAALAEAGMSGGAMVFHPWRWNTAIQTWEIGPHFHIIGYGHLDTKTFQDEYSPTINLIKVHAGDEIHSVYLTVAYLLTHSGVAKIPARDNEINWTKRFIAQIKRNWKKTKIRGGSEYDLWKNDSSLLTDGSFDIPDGDGIQERLGSFYDSRFDGIDQSNFVATFENPRSYNDPSDQSDDDYDGDDGDECAYGFDTSFQCDDSSLDGFNWKHFVMAAYTKRFQTITYFGAISTKNIRVFGVYKENVRRKCFRCDSEMNNYVFDGEHLRHHEDLYSVRNSRAVCRESELPMVKALYQKYKTELIDEGCTLQDFAKWVPQLVTPEDMGIQPQSDEDTVESRRQARSEVTVHLISSNGTGTVLVMSKKKARAAGYVKGDEECPSMLTVEMKS